MTTGYSLRVIHLDSEAYIFFIMSQKSRCCVVEKLKNCRVPSSACFYLDQGENIGDGVVRLKVVEESGPQTDQEEGDEAGQAQDQQQVIKEGDGVGVHIQPNNLHIGPEYIN